jgi:hypothetical protein
MPDATKVQRAMQMLREALSMLEEAGYEEEPEDTDRTLPPNRNPMSLATPTSGVNRTTVADLIRGR